MTFLNVPYAEKDEARALGARWNPGRKRWYVPTGVALDPFEKWLAKDGAPASAGAGRKDSAAAKLAVGANYVELAHDCNPFEPCATCAAELAGTPWTAARASLLDAVASLKRGR
nr:DUF5710 domain-containing protein [Massilia sp. YIM B02763]